MSGQDETRRRRIRGSRRDLGKSVLEAVSRSFFLTIRVLPAGLRQPVALAYLLARASDTIADAATAPAEQRLEWLAQLGRAIEGTGDPNALRDLSERVAPAHPGERTLMARLGECLDWLAQLDDTDRSRVRWVLERIIRGQSLDLERFGSGADGVRALPDAAALDEYTYLVAGCVGEFWTRLCFRHLKSYSRIDPAELNRLGCAFGKGLQLVNILRDLRADLAMGRCYLPADELSAVGVAPEEARQRAAAARPVNERWITVASQDLESAFRYIEAINPLRLRFACFLPWYLGMRTLALLREQPLETKDRVKVPRCEVRRAMALGIGAAASNGILRRVRRVLVF